MFFNFTNKNQFTMRLQLKWGNIEVVKEMKILGTIIDDSLSWDTNCSQLIKKLTTECICSGVCTALVPPMRKLCTCGFYSAGVC